MREIIAKYIAGRRPTHNGDGQYILVWRLWSDGRVERTNSRGKYRPVKAGETLPREIVTAAENHGVTLQVERPSGDAR